MYTISFQLLPLTVGYAQVLIVDVVRILMTAYCRIILKLRQAAVGVEKSSSH
jgi:hypothetical protein